LYIARVPYNCQRNTIHAQINKTTNPTSYKGFTENRDKETNDKGFDEIHEREFDQEATLQQTRDHT